MEFVRREGARRLLDVGPSNTAWLEQHDQVLARVPGAIVRLRPPAAASPERVEALRVLLVGRGAVAVKVLPPAAGDAPVPREPERAPVRGIREVVEACTERARSRDPAALRALLDRVLTEEGL